MIKHLLKQIWAQRSVNAWLWFELMIVSVCLFYVMDYLYVTDRTMVLHPFAPQGLSGSRGRIAEYWFASLQSKQFQRFKRDRYHLGTRICI